MREKSEKVIIVGAGMAGLTAGAYLSRDGYSVEIFDKLDRVGGLVSTFEREGFSFDTGPRAFVNSAMVKPILRDLEIEWEELENNISMIMDEESFKITSLESIYDYENALKKLYPGYENEISKIIKVITKLSKHTRVLYEFDNPYFVDYTSNKKVLFTEFLPWLFKLFFSLKTFDRFALPAEDYLCNMVDNQSLVDVILQMFFAKTPAYFALGYFQVYLDYFYLKGGTGTLPKLVKDKIMEHEGKITLDTEIKSILAGENKVIDDSGNEYFYDHLIWACDLKSLYKQVDTTGLESNVVKEVTTQSAKVLSSKAAESVFIMFLAVDLDPKYFDEKGGEHFFFTPSTHGLREVIRGEKIRLIQSEEVNEEEIIEWVDQFTSLNTFEVSIPSLRDTDLAPKGKTGIMISCLMDFELIDKINKAGYTKLFKDTMEKKIIDVFSRNHFKELKESIMFSFSTTPVEIRNISGNSEGSIVGWSFEKDTPVQNQLKHLSKTVFTPIPDVYKASQWAYAPAGVPIAMLTGWQACQKVLKNKKK